MTADTPDATAQDIRWEVFANTDADQGGWFSYVEGGGCYLGGDLHPTKDQAEAHAKMIASRAILAAEPAPATVAPKPEP